MVTSKDVNVYDEISYLNDHFIAVNEWELWLLLKNLEELLGQRSSSELLTSKAQGSIPQHQKQLISNNKKKCLPYTIDY